MEVSLGRIEQPLGWHNPFYSLYENTIRPAFGWSSSGHQRLRLADGTHPLISTTTPSLDVNEFVHCLRHARICNQAAQPPIQN